MASSTINPGMSLSFQTRLICKSIDKNISRPAVHMTRTFLTNKSYHSSNQSQHSRNQLTRVNRSSRQNRFKIKENLCFDRIQVVSHFGSKSNYLSSRGASSKPSEQDGTVRSKQDRFFRHETAHLLIKLNIIIKKQYSEIKQKTNVMAQALNESVARSARNLRPALLQSDVLDSSMLKSSQRNRDGKDDDSLNKTVYITEGNNQSDSPFDLVDSTTKTLPATRNVKSLRDDPMNLNQVIDSSDGDQSNMIDKVSTLQSLRSNTFKSATDNMTQELQETLTMIKKRISNIPRLDHLTNISFQQLKRVNRRGRIKSAFDRNKELPSPAGEGYTLEDTLLEMGGSTVNIVGSPKKTSIQSKSQERSAALKMKTFLDQSVKSLKKQEKKAVDEHNMEYKTISKASIDNRTRALSLGVCSAETTAMKLLRVERLADHILQYPESRGVAVHEKVIPALLKMQNTWDKALAEHVHMCLALLGHVPPVKGRGLRVLCIDGGGARGVIPIEVLRELERCSNCPIRDMFDYIIGVSSGGVLAFLLTFAKLSLDECSDIYKGQPLEVFKRNTFIGTGKLFLNHAFYDTEGWTNILKTYPMANSRMIESAKDPTCPKIATVATLINHGALKDYLFRNYNHPAGVTSRYLGSCSYQSWQALRASSAAPGYFEEHKIDDYIFQDGGVLTNNPCALAIHECKLLWPNTPIQCVVSLGTGRWDPKVSEVNQGFSTLKEKLVKIMLSATDTQSVHTIMNDLLPVKAYYRFNPTLSEDFDLDENRPEKLSIMEGDIQAYLQNNQLKTLQAVEALTQKKTTLQKVGDWVKHKHALYQN